MSPDTPVEPSSGGEVMFALLIIVTIGLFAWRLSRSWKTTKAKRDQAVRIILIRPVAGARDYPVCLIHGQRVPKKGDPCAVCLFDLEHDLDEWEKQT